MEQTLEDELLLQKLRSFCEINEQFRIAFEVHLYSYWIIFTVLM
jgi:hypothetical protein